MSGEFRIRQARRIRWYQKKNVLVTNVKEDKKNTVAVIETALNGTHGFSELGKKFNLSTKMCSVIGGRNE